ncbi:MAG: hypothetical protein J5519_04995 [Bacteroidales bacterium]|nr:hypothetical protein [Bacteroidales bacterium]
MRRILFSLLSAVLVALPVLAQDRIYVVTDRSAYLAGDLVYCSLFCVDDQGRQSGFSAVSYLELISSEGTAVEAKVGLFEGRGAGWFRLPLNMPTGNYSLLAYTARSQAAPDAARTLAVFNSTSKARVAGGVNIVPEKQYVPFIPADAEDGLTLSIPARVRTGREATLLLNGLDQDADISLSIYHEDGLAPADGKTLSAFLGGRPAAPGPRMGEYEGEIVYATVEGLPKDASLTDNQATAILSSAGSPSNVYVGRNTADGRLQFFTGNIYGDRELVCEVNVLDGQQCHINLASPFTHPEAPAVPQLVLSSAQRSALVNRKASLQAQVSLPDDTLARFLPKREDLLLEENAPIRYHLDDYTRFPTVREICVEFVRELQFVRRGDRWQIRLITSDATDSRKYVQENVLVMMDGVVITDHSLLADFDALLLEDIDIYPQGIILGGISYNGVVNFISKMNYVTALHFADNVRVVDFKGVSYPVAYPGGVPSQGQDLRQLLYWNPALEMTAGQSRRVSITAPAYAGRFRVVAEGWKADGTPIRATYTFEVE